MKKRGGRAAGVSAPASLEAVMATAVDGAILEIKASLLEIEPQLEGLTDFRALDLLAPARTEINEAIVRYERRVNLLHSALECLEDLVFDGHPEMAIEEIPQEAYADLKANRDTIEAALAKFSAASAASLGLEGGEGEPK